MKVTEEMAEAACRVWYRSTWWDTARPDELRQARSSMRRALVAALAVPVVHRDEDEGRRCGERFGDGWCCELGEGHRGDHQRTLSPVCVCPSDRTAGAYFRECCSVCDLPLSDDDAGLAAPVPAVPSGDGRQEAFEEAVLASEADRPPVAPDEEPEGERWHWLDDRTGRIYHEGEAFGVNEGPGSWNGGVCEPRPVREQCPSELLGRCFLDAGHHGDHRGPEPFNAKWSDTKPGQLIGPPLFAERPITQSEVVVSRTDLEAACEFADVEHWNMAPGQRRVFDRLRAVLNTENQT